MKILEILYNYRIYIRYINNKTIYTYIFAF